MPKPDFGSVAADPQITRQSVDMPHSQDFFTDGPLLCRHLGMSYLDSSISELFDAFFLFRFVDAKVISAWVQTLETSTTLN